MNENHKDYIRGFHHLSRAWYGPTNLACGGRVDTITIGLYLPDGDTVGEFSVEWGRLGGQLTARLIVFNGAWSALTSFSDVLEKMAEVDGQNITPDNFTKILVELKITDLTETERV